MTLCLNECLRAVGLQHHYARFTSMGVKHVAHLSALTLEDYPNLGIKTMKDRTRLFHLIQMVKTLDLENIGFEDSDDYDDYGADGGDIGNTIVDTSFTYDGYGDPDEGVYDDDEDKKGGATNNLNAATFARTSCVRRRLDFSCEESDHHQKLLSHPLGSLHVRASPNRNDGPVQGNWSATPLQLELDNGSAVVCVCRRNNSQRTDAHSCPSNPHKEGNTKPDIIGGAAMYNTHTKSSPKFLSFHKQKSRSATMASKRFSTKPVGYIDRKRISKKEKLSTEIGSDEAFGRTVKPTPIYESKRTTGYNYGLPQSSPPVPNRKKDGEQRISVCVRKRPLTQTESRRGEADVVTTSVGECVIVHESKEAVDLTQYILQHRFYFDQVFGEESSNEEVYQRSAHPLVQHMLNGGKATCFAYGQTGAGKTHTMLGSSPRRPGLYALAVRDIFAHLSTTCMHSPLLVYVSFFEIYCGQLYDLLDHRKRLFAREDGHKVVHIAGLRDVRVDSVSSLLEVISQGTEERTQGMSGVNPLSSRSHALLQIQLRGQNQQIAGRMWFVDLAGSERASDSKEPDKQSRMEGAEINQSLLALKECIRSLDQEQSHTPFRQSKLTQVLRDSFVGDSMTCMIANISPGHLATEHTLNTLRYADRVKELRGQRTPRGGRRGKTLNSPKHNQFSNKSSSGSSIGTRGKSPPKRQKLGRQRDVDGPTTSKTKLTTGDPIFCSKPKNRRWRVETSARGSKGTGLELITPVSDWLEIGDERHRWEEAGERKGRRRENERYGKTNSHSISDQNPRKGLVLGHPKDEQLNLWEVQNSLTQRVSGICLREKENQQSTMKGERDKERRLIQQRRQLENSRDACREGERLRERELQKAAERDKERQRHLRHYHQQLQQFIPSSASLLSSNQTSLSSSVSPSLCSSLRHSFHHQASASMCHGLEEVLDMYRAGIDVRADCNRGQLPFSSGEICLQSETSLCCKYSNNEDAPGDSGGVGEVWKVSWEGTDSRFGQDRERRSVESTGGARVRREDRRPAGIEGGERRWAWVPPTETDQADWVAGAMPGNVVSYSCHSEDRQQAGEEGLDSSDVPADGVWSAEEKGGAVSCGLLSTHSNNDSNSLFNCPPFESPHQRAPAERPLSPASEHINTLLSPNKLSDPSLGAKHTRCFSHSLPLPLQNTHFSSVLSPTLPLPTSITQTGYKKPVDPLNKLSENSACTQVHNHLEVKAEISALPQDEINSDSLSHIIDPFSISLLQVDPQVSTASFLQEEQNDTSLCLLNNERREDKRRKAEHHSHAAVAGKAVEDEDIELHLSFLDLPHCPPISDTKTAVSHTERGKETSVATYEHCGIGRTKPPMSEVMLVSLEDQENSQTPQTMPVHGNKAPATPLKASTCSSVQTSIVQSISPSIWHPRNTDSPSSHNLIANGATQMPTEHSHMFNKCAFSISIPQSESVLGQYDTVHSNDSSNSNNSLQQNSPEESNSQESTSNQQTRPLIHLSTPEDLDHAQWCIVQSHWEQLEEMEVLWHKEGTLLCQQPDMAFGEYVHKLEEIMERKALCIRSMRAQLRPYLKPVHSNQPHKHEDNNNPVT